MQTSEKKSGGGGIRCCSGRAGSGSALLTGISLDERPWAVD